MVIKRNAKNLRFKTAVVGLILAQLLIGCVGVQNEEISWYDLTKADKVELYVENDGLDGPRVRVFLKPIENTQRDVNIALMNELSIIFDRMGINTYDVLEAAATKWNFLRFSPGLVGGHCIGVDPYYLVHKAKELQYHPKMINSGRFVNDSMGRYIAKKIVKRVLLLGKNILRARVLVMGITFKENVSDIRNSKVVDMIREFQDFGALVDVVDPKASPAEVERAYGLPLLKEPSGPYDAIVVAVAHAEYRALDEPYFLSLARGQAVLGDVKGIYRHHIRQLDYWSL